MNKKKKKRETSKTLLWVLINGLCVIAICSIIASFLLQDTSPLITLIECVTRLTSIAVGFYFWKSKNENLHKYNQDHKIGDINNNYEE
jgi:L-asparagine transporter-like permease